MEMKRTTVIIILIAGLLTAGSSALAAEAAGADQTPLILILDASGSMWGKLGDKSKIEIAKDSLSEIIQGLPDNSQVGLMAYGHRSKSDCNDVELLIPLAKLDKAKTIKAIRALNPKGMTPITNSIKQAAEIVKATGKDGTIILVSDGQETCRGDPCQLVKDLKQSGIKFVMNVVGFDVSAKEREQLECLAKSGGGMYYAAKNAGEFKLAAQAVTDIKPEKKEPPAGEGKVWLDEPAVAIAGSEIKVHFEADKRFHKHAWIGIIPSDIPHGNEKVNDEHDTTYEYILGRTSGEMTLTAPGQPGSYDVRMHDTNDPDGHEVASATFTVKAAEGLIKLDKNEFVSGEQVKIQFDLPAVLSGQAWLGIIPSDIPHGKETVNDEHDLSFSYLDKKKSGTITLNAPPDPGQYDVRLNDSDGGSEIASVSFTVKSGQAEVKLDKSEFVAGEPMAVHFSLPAVLSPQAWAGTVPSDIPHGKERVNNEHYLVFEYLGQKQNGTLTLPAPSRPGKYDVRLNDDSGGNEIGSVSFSVRLAKGELMLDRKDYEPGERIVVHFKVETKLNPRAWVGLIPTQTPHGSEEEGDKVDLDFKYLGEQTAGDMTFTAPQTAGTYDLRLYDTSDDGNELASVSFTVQ